MKSNILPHRILILHDIRSAQNVGAIFRTADAAGIQEIYLTGITPAPIDKFNRPNSLIAKAALGAEETIPWKKIVSPSQLFRKLLAEKIQVIAIEQSPNAVDYKKIKVEPRTAFILGNEVDGLPKKILERVSVIAEIPMKGTKESLNVSVAAGIALFRMLRI